VFAVIPGGDRENQEILKFSLDNRCVGDIEKIYPVFANELANFFARHFGVTSRAAVKQADGFVVAHRVLSNKIFKEGGSM
jgi:hypothetical protein